MRKNYLDDDDVAMAVVMKICPEVRVETNSLLQDVPEFAMWYYQCQDGLLSSRIKPGICRIRSRRWTTMLKTEYTRILAVLQLFTFSSLTS
jgi:hypothetical protein